MRDEQLYLLDIIEAADAIERFLEGITESDFDSSDMVQSAVVYKLTIIGEAASHISPEIRSKYPEVVWKSVIGFRNIVVHEYFWCRL